MRYYNRQTTDAQQNILESTATTTKEIITPKAATQRTMSQTISDDEQLSGKTLGEPLSARKMTTEEEYARYYGANSGFFDEEDYETEYEERPAQTYQRSAKQKEPIKSVKPAPSEQGSISPMLLIALLLLMQNTNSSTC
jgi:hypothetical protein